MAVNLDDVLSIGAKQTILFDPTGGMRDLEKGVLRPVSLENLRKDPVRILRGYRLSAEKKLTLTEDFKRFAQGNLKLLLKSPPERISHELFKIMKNRNSSAIVREVYRAGILGTLIPELKELKKIADQGERHIYSLEEHTFRTLEELERVIDSRTRYLSAELLENFGCRRFMGEFTDVELLKWAALFHDIGKPATFEVREGKVTFYNHDRVGEEIVKGIGRRLRWGEKATRFTASLVRYHLRPFFLRESFLRGDLGRKGMANFWRDCGSIAPHLFLLSIADAIASGDSEEDIKALLETISELESFSRNELRKEEMEPLLNGYEIMALLNIPEGRAVGEIKRKLLEAQLEGIVRTKEEAVEFVKRIHTAK